jgi:hypothetical protein
VQSFMAANLLPLRIFAIDNPTLTQSFVNLWKIFTRRKQVGGDVFFVKTYHRNPAKLWAMECYEYLCAKFVWNAKIDMPLVVAFHGTFLVFDYYLSMVFKYRDRFLRC